MRMSVRAEKNGGRVGPEILVLIVSPDIKLYAVVTFKTAGSPFSDRGTGWREAVQRGVWGSVSSASLLLCLRLFWSGALRVQVRLSSPCMLA